MIIKSDEPFNFVSFLLCGRVLVCKLWRKLFRESYSSLTEIVGRDVVQVCLYDPMSRGDGVIGGREAAYSKVTIGTVGQGIFQPLWP